MKLTKSWLEEHLDIKENISNLCNDLTMAGLEVDEIVPLKNDYIIDIDLTPNRADCLSVMGIARELNCINKKYSFKKLKNEDDPRSSCENINLSLDLDDKKICPRFAYMTLRNVSKAKQTPEDIAKKLKDIGVGLVHPIVDILNYININFGQPMHAYDLDKISNEITIRLSKKNEEFIALDKKKYKLDEGNIIICDKDQIISLAGIIGADHCAVDDSTKNILIESAFFPPNLIANKARMLKLQTESSQRFERGVDFNLPEKALKVLGHIISCKEICDFSDIRLIENEKYLPEIKEVSIGFEKIRQVLGVEISDSEIENILKSLGGSFNKKTNKIKNPSFRYDLEIHADYIEEVARLYGYDNIPVVSEKIDLKPEREHLSNSISRQIKDYLYKNNFSECINYSFTNNDPLENFNWLNEPFKEHKLISNFMSSEQSKLRSNILSSIIKNIEYNINVNPKDSYRFFEMSTIFANTEENILTCVVNGKKDEENWDAEKRKFDKYDMTTIVEDLSRLFGLEKSDFLYKIDSVSKDNKEYISLSICLGSLIQKIKNNSSESCKNYSKFPYIRRDLSFLIDLAVSYKEILKLVEEINVLSLKKILLFDLYEGKGVPNDKKSLGIGFIFQDETKTLTHEEADKDIEIILNKLKDKFNIELRK